MKKYHEISKIRLTNIIKTPQFFIFNKTKFIINQLKFIAIVKKIQTFIRRWVLFSQ